MTKLLFTSAEWTIETLGAAQDAVEKIATEELGLNLYPMQVEVISSDQMLDCYASHGLPINYEHWSIGKQHARESYNYKKGHSGLAYEIIVNTKPCIAYLMENNSMLMQTLVLAHCTGHNHFFANNYEFTQWTQADAIVDYMKFAREYIKSCEDKYGVSEVEKTLDACHALRYNSIDKYKRKAKSKKQMQKMSEMRAVAEDLSYRETDRLIKPKKNKKAVMDVFPEQPEENLLYFLEKFSPKLKPWQRELCRIVRKVSQYFWPQMQTKVMNEGWACFCHYYIMHRLYEMGLITEGNMLEFYENHSGVVLQTYPDFRTEEEKKRDRMRGRRDPIPYQGINVYALGFAMMMDIKRICEDPTEEDIEWFPTIANTNWRDTLLDIVKNYRDESFIRQFLSPKLIREFGLFSIHDDEHDTNYIDVHYIHNQNGYRKIRNIMADNYDSNLRIPNIQVKEADLKGNRKLVLHYHSVQKRLLTEDSQKVLKYVKQLWGYDVALISLDQDEKVMNIEDTSKL